MTTACPQIKDREDEEELLTYFQLTLGEEREEEEGEERGEIIKLYPLDHDSIVLPLLTTEGDRVDEGMTRCLIVSLKSAAPLPPVKQHVVEAVICSTPSKLTVQPWSTGELLY